jgi:hypothetical protein
MLARKLRENVRFGGHVLSNAVEVSRYQRLFLRIPRNDNFHVILEESWDGVGGSQIAVA